ncbi:DUF3072 domain-containing protein [Arenibaculum pallidiluteum]|uniref:DUF3072 domain-containing protein n=1 Tax=Arenibaculum pallidiluteum TaxID=2812559 RepID=UPI001A95E758|nr:DUF3072 domain-containing protein [Arenibaculum pallidiluteum]
MADDKRSDREQSHESPSAEAARVQPEAPMTANQAGRLRTLSAEAGVPFQEDAAMTAAEAERRIHDLQNRSGYGDDPPKPVPEKPKGA